MQNKQHKKTPVNCFLVCLSGGEGEGLQEGEAEGEEASGGGRLGFRGGRRDGGCDGLLRLWLLQEESLMPCRARVTKGQDCKLD